MDPNLMSCATCGHSVNNIAGACTYCGAMMVDAGQQPQTDDKGIGEKVQVTESPPPLTQEETLAADIMSDEAVETPLAAADQSESDVFQQPADSPAAAETSASATEAETVSADEAVSHEEEIESKPFDDEQGLETKPESGKLTQGTDGDFEIDMVDAFELESVPDAEAESAADKVQSPPEPGGGALPGDEAGEPETLGETNVDLTESEASQQASETPTTLETSPPLEKPVEEAATESIEEMQPKNEADMNTDAKAEIITESLDDTIVLEADDEVESAAGELPDKGAESAKSKSQLKALEIEKDAQKIAAAIKEQKTALIKAQALKKQKAALAKAQALKKQKLILAKTAALKRKKAVQAKAQALKKQKAAQADIEAAKMDDRAAVNTAAAADSPKTVPGLQADTTMQTLLQKYKGQAIGINYDNSAEIREAQLTEANAEYFSVFVKGKDLHYSYPLKTILSIIEGKDGVDTGNSKQPNMFRAVIKVFPLVIS